MGDVDNTKKLARKLSKIITDLQKHKKDKEEFSQPNFDTNYFEVQPTYSEERLQQELINYFKRCGYNVVKSPHFCDLIVEKDSLKICIELKTCSEIPHIRKNIGNVTAAFQRGLGQLLFCKEVLPCDKFWLIFNKRPYSKKLDVWLKLFRKLKIGVLYFNEISLKRVKCVKKKKIS